MNSDNAADQLAMQELSSRLNLIETMIAQGRQKTESWGWTFLLWGVAYAGAIIASNVGWPIQEWSSWGHRSLAWPVAVVSAFILMFVIIMTRARRGPSQPDTTAGRAIFAMWIAMGISMFLLLQVAGMSGRLDQQLFVAIVAAMLGTTNAASAILLKWRVQFCCAIVWWATAVISCLASVSVSTIAFLIAIFVCQIVFGGYGMVSESRQREAEAANSPSGAAHA
jgi:hypothetical protein